MARVAGYGGSVVTVSGTVETAVTGIREWTLDYTVNVLDGRGFDSAGLPYPVVGARSWGGGFAGPKDGAPMGVFSAVALRLKEGTTFWEGSAIVTEIHPAVNFDGLVEYGYTFVGSGTLTVATA